MSLSPLRSRVSRFSLVIMTLTLIATFFLPVPFVTIKPGPARNVLGDVITIEDKKTYKAHGKLFITSVYVTSPDSIVFGGETIFNWLSGDAAVFPHDVVFPETIPTDVIVAEDKAEMDNSQNNATYAALTYLGYKLSYSLEVADVIKGSGAVGVLQKGDQISQVNSKKVEVPADIREVLQGKKAGDVVTVIYLRKGKTYSSQISLKDLTVGKAKIGISLISKVNSPIKVRINLKNTGGPSGGLVFAIGIIEKLTEEDLLRGRLVAGTGTIDVRGNVGPIGGITEKLKGASAAGATLFLAPVEHCIDIGKIPANLVVVAVATLDEAIRALQSQTPGELPTCAQYLGTVSP